MTLPVLLINESPQLDCCNYMKLTKEGRRLNIITYHMGTIVTGCDHPQSVPWLEAINFPPPQRMPVGGRPDNMHFWPMQQVVKVR